MSPAVPLWVEVVVSLLLVISGVFALAGAIGLLRFKVFMLRLHAPGLGASGATWAVSFAITLYFTAIESSLSTHAWLIIIFLTLTVPITTILLARAAQLRERQHDGRAVADAGETETETEAVSKRDDS